LPSCWGAPLSSKGRRSPPAAFACCTWSRSSKVFF
jgi:hypothetical protein